MNKGVCPQFIPLRSAFFVLTKSVLKDYFSEDPQVSENAEFIIDFIKFSSCKAYLCNNLHGEMVAQVAGKDEAFQYIDSLFESGKSLVGTATFGVEDKDIIFLSGALTLFKNAKEIYIIINDSEDLKVKHSEVMKKLGKMGLKELNLIILTISFLVKTIRTFDSEFMSYVYSLYPNNT